MWLPPDFFLTMEFMLAKFCHMHAYMRARMLHEIYFVKRFLSLIREKFVPQKNLALNGFIIHIGLDVLSCSVQRVA